MTDFILTPVKEKPKEKKRVRKSIYDKEEALTCLDCPKVIIKHTDKEGDVWHECTITNRVKCVPMLLASCPHLKKGKIRAEHQHIIYTTPNKRIKHLEEAKRRFMKRKGVIGN